MFDTKSKLGTKLSTCILCYIYTILYFLLNKEKTCQQGDNVIWHIWLVAISSPSIDRLILKSVQSVGCFLKFLLKLRCSIFLNNCCFVERNTHSYYLWKTSFTVHVWLYFANNLMDVLLKRINCLWIIAVTVVFTIHPEKRYQSRWVVAVGWPACKIAEHLLWKQIFDILQFYSSIKRSISYRWSCRCQGHRYCWLLK